MKRVRIVAASDARREPHIRAKWEQMLDQYSGTTLFYQSPEYFDHLTELRAESAFLVIVEADDGTPIGIAPMRKSSVLLKFEVRDHRFVHVSFPGIRILGGMMLAPQSPEVFELLFRQVAQSFRDCDAIEVNGLPTTSLLWDFFENQSIAESGLYDLRAERRSQLPHGASPGLLRRLSGGIRAQEAVQPETANQAPRSLRQRKHDVAANRSHFRRPVFS
jgi:hypothetical protein